MTVPVLTFFNNKGGVGKTSLVFHLAWMLADMGKRVVAIDLDPQANLTAAFLSEDELEILWTDDADALTNGRTIYQCVRPLTEVGDINEPEAQKINARLHLIPGDLALSSFEDTLSREWPDAMGSSNLHRPFRVLASLWLVAQLAAKRHKAHLILADVGPNLGAINRSALIGSDFVVFPLGADLFSLQGLRNLGPTLRRWRVDWSKRVENWQKPRFELPKGAMAPLGYVVMQHGQRLSRPVKAYKKWADRIPGTYETSILDNQFSQYSAQPDGDCLAQIRHYRSLAPMAQEARKPIFKLTTADGAIGSHAAAVQDAEADFRKLATTILDRTGLT